MKLEFSQQIFEKYPNIKFHENPCCGSGVVCFMRTHTHTHTYRRTNRHDDANNGSCQFCENA